MPWRGVRGTISRGGSGSPGASSPAISRLALVAGLVGLLVAGACGPAATPAEGAPMPGELRKREATRVRTVPLARHEMVRTLSTATTVESEREITIYPRTAGVVIALGCEEGDRVAEGAELAQLDAREQEAALAEAEVALREAHESLAKSGLAKEEAHARWERAKLTYEQAARDYERNEQAGLISHQDLDRLRLTRDTAEHDLDAARILHEVAGEDEKSAQTAIERAKLAVERARLDLSYTRIVAPFAGVVARRSIRVGDSVSNATAAFVLTDAERVRAVFHRPQRELPLFRAAMASPADGLAGAAPIEIRVTSEALPGREFVGRIRLVSPTIDVSSGSFRVTVDLEQPEDPRARLLPGMLVRLEVVTDRHADALVVPKRAILREGEATYVFEIAEGKAHRVEVREGFSDDESVEIVPLERDVLSAGDEIVVVGNRELEQGTLVAAEPWIADGDAGTLVQERIEGAGRGTGAVDATEDDETSAAGDASDPDAGSEAASSDAGGDESASESSAGSTASEGGAR